MQINAVLNMLSSLQIGSNRQVKFVVLKCAAVLLYRHIPAIC